MSILGGQVQVSGYGQYIWSPSANSREASATLVHKLTTKVLHKYLSFRLIDNNFQYEAVDVNNSKVLYVITPNSIRSSPQATHVVVGIQWGVTTISSVKCSNEDPSFKAVDALKVKKVSGLKARMIVLGQARQHEH